MSDPLYELLCEDAASQIVKDMADHVGEQVHGILKRSAMIMPNVSMASAMGVLAARQMLEETILFARNSMDGDAEDSAALEDALRRLFEGLAP